MTKDQTKIKKRSVLIAKHRTSISLEEAFWDRLKKLADIQGKSINALIAQVDVERTGNLSSAIRVYVLENLDLLKK